MIKVSITILLILFVARCQQNKVAPQIAVNTSKTIQTNSNSVKTDEQQHASAKKTIKQLISTSQPQRIKHFYDNLDQQARKYYDIVVKQLQEQRKKQQAQMKVLQQNAVKQNQQILTPSQAILFNQKKQQQRQLAYIKQKFPKLRDHQNYLSVLCETKSLKQERFKFKAVSTRQIFIYISIFEQIQGVYEFPKQIIQNKDSILFQITEGGSTIYRKQYYSRGILQFTIKQNTQYQLKFTNKQAGHKIISFKYPVILQESQIKNKVTVQDVANHTERTNNIFQNIKTKYEQANNNIILSQSNIALLGDKLKIYGIYNIVELFFIISICILEVQCLRKLLINSATVV